MSKFNSYRGIPFENIVSVSDVYKGYDDTMYEENETPPEICYWVDVKHKSANDINTFYQGFKHLDAANDFHKVLTGYLKEAQNEN